MLRAAEHLKGMTLSATDGEIGTVKDAYFGDDDWTLRYLVVDTGGWLAGRKVLITPVAIRGFRWGTGLMDVRLNREQVQSSPDIDTDKPVSRQKETSFHDYYGYPYYWAGPNLWGPGPFPSAAADAGIQQIAFEQTAAGRVQEREKENYDPHLRSINAVAGYHIEATDGEIGHVEDFMYDDQTWTIRFLVVGTGNWLPGKHVLVAVDSVDSVSWADRAARVTLTRDVIRESPEYDGSAMLEPETESQLLRYFEARSHDLKNGEMRSR